ncbi:sulfotransferase domain-containing protein [Sphingomonas sp. GB1N7]|uniref:sulfotransferase domain-containing protein n=1 Tax=Parasphingomonas caseinilytica TaxID=3096158 RepID=UPI002FC6F077
MNRIVWLASYPKSGNTWFRLLVANLQQDAPVDINDMSERGGIASARHWFDNIMMFPAGLLTHEECDALRPRVYRAIAAEQETQEPEEEAAETRFGGVRFVKSHDAYTYISSGEPLLGGAAAASGAILIVRDPRDVAPSLANHNNQSVDEAIAFMGSATSSLSGRPDRQFTQLRQQLPTWAGYHLGWLDQTDIPLHVVRYEDLRADTAGVLREALAFAGITVSQADCEQAARFADFDALKQQESERGFREAPRANPAAKFFRRGIAGGWRDELTTDQVARIEVDQAAMMARLGYALSDEDERMKA